jgi:GNAT superfamily N-acetyltransferase
VSADVLVLAPGDPNPLIPAAEGMTLTSEATRRAEAADASLIAIRNGMVEARCSCWWRSLPSIDSVAAGAIGHYAAVNGDAGAWLLEHACAVLASNGCRRAVGPMDGSTWHPYRFVVERGPHAAFFLEPDHPDEWPEHWRSCHFTPTATYTSAIADPLDDADQRTPATLARLGEMGIAIRPLDTNAVESDVARMFEVTLAAFASNFLFVPIEASEFAAQTRRLLPFVRPELVLLAEVRGELVGFLFALPDALEARRTRSSRTLIIKTVAVHPTYSGIGLASALVDLTQQTARRLGFERVIHALMHDDNPSRRISDEAVCVVWTFGLRR